ncbi:thermosome subunit beta [Candidatus Methanoliparum sp. LAM-1]|uniref:thermosome subunit beta n=1 Tax=Candidatus Methanoliparum sp. LAM-1 TaxID=2874846 RepID=UPI001E2EEED2|nr:thermosome subunit beta [Candidatus Methanoliparum sp. LAM-1]BDC36660.1 thermosome subunit [Candidatus Methanoliparum sp. LAM-1]
MAQLGGMPILVLKEGTERRRGKDAQSGNIMAAKAVAEAVRTTLGPKGMDKMIVDSLGDVTVTNDGVTILKEMDIEHPAAKMMVEVAKTQDDEVGDGTTTAVVLAGALLKGAEELLNQDIHPTTISKGFRLAAKEVKKVIKEIAEDISKDDKDLLKKMALTSLAGRGTEDHEKTADLCVDAVLAIAEESNDEIIADIDLISVIKKVGGRIDDSKLINGMIIDKERVNYRMPEKIENAKIALLNDSIEVKKTEFSAEIQIKSPEQMQAFLDEEEKILKKMVDKIVSSGANVLFCQKGIDDLAQYYLAKNGILAVRRVKKSDMDKLSKATGAKIITKLDDITEDDLGYAGLVEERKIGDDKMVFVEDCKNPKAVSLLLKGGSEHVVDELERGIHDALRVVGITIEDKKFLPGGGATEIELSLRLKDYAPSVGGREQLAIEEFAKALEVIPRTLAENAGLDPIDALVELRKAHQEGKKTYGLDLDTGKAKDMLEAGVIEPIRGKSQAVSSAIEVTNMILSIDDVIAAKASSTGGGAGPGAGGMPSGEEEE